MEADKSPGLYGDMVGWRPRRADGVHSCPALKA